MMDISVILPSYQEEENLRVLLPKINRVLVENHINYEILVIDTESPTDNTSCVCTMNNAKYVNREGGNSYGDAIRTGVLMAQSEYTVIMDADGSHNPSDIIRFFKEMKEGTYDIVIGSRYCKGGHTDNNFILIAMSYLLNFTYRIAFGIDAKDISDSYRMYNTVHLKNISLECDNFDIVEEILIKLKNSKQDFSIKEVPIDFSKRDKGESKRDLVKFIISYISTMRKLIKIEHSTK